MSNLFLFLGVIALGVGIAAYMASPTTVTTVLLVVNAAAFACNVTFWALQR